MIIVCQFFLKNTKISAITLFPFIILRKQELRQNPVLINHERIHLRQQLELLIIFFYMWYVIEYYFHYFRLKDPYKAYRMISFEREAFSQEQNFGYLKERKLWSFYRYRS
ncbi:MAG: hypothetical protein ACXWCF_01115 [Kaistella sp.]